MVQAEYIAWSLYTGPTNIHSIFKEDGTWAVGQWDGINSNTYGKELKNDIDNRISVILRAFRRTLRHFKTPDRHFVIPEFFFRCAEGPYPYKKVDGKNYPFEYIVSTLQEKLKACIPPDDNNDYTIIIGSTLTSNIRHYNKFLNSRKVRERQRHLNDILPKYIHEKFKKYHRYRKILNSEKAQDRQKQHPKKRVHEKIKEYHFHVWKRKVNYGPSSNPSIDKLNKFMREARINPLCTVRNRGAYFHFSKELRDGEVFIYEKQSEAGADLTMGMFNSRGELTANGMITEWLANYPSYSIYGGDKQTETTSTANAKFSPPTNARFSPSGDRYIDKDVGVEICLDHVYQRLRRTVCMNTDNGANATNNPLIKQFIVSGGMQIWNIGVAAHCNSVIFNADGMVDVVGAKDLKRDRGKCKGITNGVYTQSIQSKWIGRDKKYYYSHSQIAFTTDKSKIDGFNNAEGTNNIKALTYECLEESPHNKITDSFSPLIIVRSKIDKVDKGLFALNMGELHYYAPNKIEI